MLSSGANLALRRIANEDTGDRGKVFVCVIRVVYCTPGFSVSKRISKNEACSCFLLWPPSISQVAWVPLKQMILVGVYSSIL